MELNSDKCLHELNSYFHFDDEHAINRCFAAKLGAFTEFEARNNSYIFPGIV